MPINVTQKSCCGKALDWEQRNSDKYNFRKVIRQCVRPFPEMTGHGLTSTFHL